MSVYGLYIHVPFCISKCRYCDFASVPLQQALVKPYIRAVARELDSFPGKLRPKTVYFGGGTPTILQPEDFEKLFSVVRERIDPAKVVEWTIEANPGTLTASKIRTALDAGVNRFSLGVQSLDDRILRFLGRTHTARDALRAIERFRNAGVKNISADLIHGVPGTDLADYIEGLHSLVKTGVPHISAYGLTYEPGTPLYEDVHMGRLEPLGEEDELFMYLATVTGLSALGYMRYEVSSFAKKGFESKHNVAYWENRETLGAGPSAASYVDGVRRSNVRDVEKYISRISECGTAVEIEEKLKGRRKAGEILYLALRTARGITEKRFQKVTGMKLTASFGKEIKKMSGLGLVEFKRGRLRLTEKGFTVADGVVMEFL